MQITADQLRKGEKAIITDIDSDTLPLKLLEMGCLPGNSVELLQVAPLGDPIYFDINGARLAIRKETARFISVETHE